jgi:hypothetical protein
MLTVAILLNGHPLVAKNAINLSRKNKKGQTAYRTDSGEIIWHAREEGAVALAHKLLKTIRNDKPPKAQPRELSS